MNLTTRKRLALGSALLAGTVATVLAVKLITFFTSGPRFGGNVPASIEIVMEQPGENGFYVANITEARACSNILRVLAEARRTDFHACPHRGWFDVRYLAGKTDMVYFLPAHESGRYEIRCKSGCYVLAKKDLWAALEVAGVNTAMMPQGSP